LILFHALGTAHLVGGGPRGFEEIPVAGLGIDLGSRSLSFHTRCATARRLLISIDDHAGRARRSYARQQAAKKGYEDEAAEILRSRPRSRIDITAENGTKAAFLRRRPTASRLRIADGNLTVALKPARKT